MRKYSWLLSSLLILPTLIACGDDGGATDDDDIVDAATGDTSTGGAMCTATEQAAIAANADAYRGVAASCGTNCAVSSPSDVSGCTATCFADDSTTAVSVACASCYGDSVECTAENCLMECSTLAGGDPESAECIACLCENDCTANFATCSGIPTSLCDPADGGT